MSEEQALEGAHAATAAAAATAPTSDLPDVLPIAVVYFAVALALSRLSPTLGGQGLWGAEPNPSFFPFSICGSLLLASPSSDLCICHRLFSSTAHLHHTLHVV